MCFWNFDVGGWCEDEGGVEFGCGFERWSCVVNCSGDLAPDFEMDMGAGSLGVAAIADPSDELTRENSLSIFYSGSETIIGGAFCVVATGAVVIHMIVLGGPTVIAFDGDGVSGISTTTSNKDCSIETCDGGCQLWRHEVLSVVSPCATATRSQERI